ncbi:MAG: LamG domain-containing protein, partial [Deltaproteobacteria bacterium]|nr:LamG domain-containing protein [Deltaproteobacteria bacterium]
SGSSYLRVSEFGPYPDNLTWSIWFRSSDRSGVQRDLLSDCEVLSLTLTDGTLQLLANLSPRGSARVPGLGDGEWHHAAVTYDGSALRLYVDGAREAESAHSPSSSPECAGLTVGSSGSPVSEPFIGQLDDLRVYGAALSASEIADLYCEELAGSGTTAPTTCEAFCEAVGSGDCAGYSYSACVAGCEGSTDQCRSVIERQLTCLADPREEPSVWCFPSGGSWPFGVPNTTYCQASLIELSSSCGSGPALSTEGFGNYCEGSFDCMSDLYGICDFSQGDGETYGYCTRLCSSGCPQGSSCNVDGYCQVP